jgi:hypothetical protein
MGVGGGRRRRSEAAPLVVVVCLVCMLRPVGSLNMGAALERQCTNGAGRFPAALVGEQCFLARRLRLRGGMPGGTGSETAPEAAAEAAGEGGHCVRGGEGCIDDSAYLRKPSEIATAAQEGQMGEITGQVDVNASAIRRVPTPTCLELSAFDLVTSQEHSNQNFGPGPSPRYAWDSRRSIWMIFKRPDEDLTIETLRGKWDFPPSDCLTYRHRKPDKWQYVDWAKGFAGWIEFFFWGTPLLNQLLYLWRGLFPCAVCGLDRSQHPCPSEREADAAFWQAVRFRDVELAVRLIRGGVDCDPGGPNWCMLAFLQGKSAVQ